MPSIRWPKRVGLGRRLVQGAIAVALTAMPAVAQSKLWLKQYGSSAYDLNDFDKSTASPDGLGGVYVCGESAGDFGGPSLGSWDAWLARLDGTGALVWLKKLGTPAWELARATAPDGQGGVYACGVTGGDFGGPNAGHIDVWVARVDLAGNTLWVTQFGTDKTDEPWTASPDGSGGVFVSGGTNGSLGGQPHGQNDPFVAHLDGTGALTWIRQFGSAKQEYAYASSPDGDGGVYVSGGIESSSDRDCWLVRLDRSGQLLWRREFGSTKVDQPSSCAPDGSGGLILAGWTYGSLAAPSAGTIDAWVCHFSSAGDRTWARQFGTADNEYCFAASTDDAGGAYLVGSTRGSLGGPSNGYEDVWLSRVDSQGNQLWMTQFGTSTTEWPEALAVDGTGGVIAFGFTYGALGGPNAGFNDAWLARYDGSCNSGKTYCTASSTSLPGCTASLTASGSPTLSNPTAWTVSTSPVPGGNLGLLLFGSSGPDNTPYGTLGGKMCVAAPTFRTAPKTSSGDQGQCNGEYTFTLADLIAAAPIVTSGATANAQVWARDPANQDGFLLSNAVEVTVCP